MMKAVIVDIQGNYAVALDKKGGFVKIKKKDNFRVGHEVDLPRGMSLSAKAFSRYAAAAAVFIFAAGMGYGAYCYNTPYSYVNVDINPSVELTANVFNRIIKAEGLNEDGKKLLASVDYKNKDIHTGIETVLSNALKEGYLKDSSTSAVVLTVSGKSTEKVEEIREDVQNVAGKEIKTAGADAEIVTEKVTLAEHDSAKQKGISPGINRLIEKAVKANPGLKEEDLKDAPVKDIIKSIEKGKKQEGEKAGNGQQGQSGSKNRNGKDDKTNDVKPGETGNAQKQEERKTGTQSGNNGKGKEVRPQSTDNGERQQENKTPRLNNGGKSGEKVVSPTPGNKKDENSQSGKVNNKRTPWDNRKDSEGDSNSRNWDRKGGNSEDELRNRGKK